jgi:hypothetical protein
LGVIRFALQNHSACDDGIGLILNCKFAHNDGDLERAGHAMERNGCIRREPRQLPRSVINKAIYVLRIKATRNYVEVGFRFTDQRTRWRLLRHSSFRFRHSRTLKQVPELGLFRLEIFFVVWIRIGPDRHLLDHFQTVALEAHDLLGIIRQEPELAHAEIKQNLRA